MKKNIILLIVASIILVVFLFFHNKDVEQTDENIIEIVDSLNVPEEGLDEGEGNRPEKIIAVQEKIEVEESSEKHDVVEDTLEVTRNKLLEKYTKEEIIRAEIYAQEKHLSRREVINFRHALVFERDPDPNWSAKTEAEMKAGLEAMEEEFNFYEKVDFVQCSDVICFISIEGLDVDFYRNAQWSFRENITLGRFHTYHFIRNLGVQSGFYLYRYPSFYIPSIHNSKEHWK